MDWKKLDRTQRLNIADDIIRELTKTGSLGERIKMVRLINYRTQAEFANTLGVSRSYLSEAENGKGKPSIEMVIGIADHYAYLNVHWLLTGEGSFHNTIEHAVDGWSVLPERHIDQNCLLHVLILMEERLGEDWLARQKGPRRKSNLLSYFYEKYASAFIDAREEKNMFPRQAHDQATAELGSLIDRFEAMGLPSIHHKELEL